MNVAFLLFAMISTHQTYIATFPAFVDGNGRPKETEALQRCQAAAKKAQAETPAYFYCIRIEGASRGTD